VSPTRLDAQGEITRATIVQDSRLLSDDDRQSFVSPSLAV
jgi:hypothetical protein